MFKYNSSFARSEIFLCKRLCSHFNKITKLVSNYTELPESEAKLFVKKHKLDNRQEHFIIDSFESYKRIGFSSKEIRDNGGLFKCYPREHEQHFWVMEEGGFTNISPPTLIRARWILKRKISKLKTQGYIPENVNVADSFLSYINKPDFLKKVDIKYNDDMAWSTVHFAIALQFLAWRLKATEKEIREIFVIHPGSANKSFRVMEENISIAEELGFSSQKIIKCAYIIRNYPGYTKQTLKEFPYLVGVDMRAAMRSIPNLMVTPTIRIRKTLEILKEFNIPDETIRKEMGIFQVSPETIRARFEEIKNCPDTEPLLKIPRLLSLLFCHTKVKSRLPFLQNMNLRCTNFYVLGTEVNEVVKRFIREGKDVNCRIDVIAYFKSILEINDGKNLAEILKKHPYYLNVPLKDIGYTFSYLVKAGFERPNIYKVLWILLYPQEKVQSILHKLKDDQSAHWDAMNQIQKLNMILYTMEKDHHFTGHGIFTNRDSDCQEQLEK